MIVTDVSAVERAISRVAESNGTTSDDVRKNIMEMLEIGRNSTDPAVRAAWSKVPCRGDVPSVEDVMLYILSRL